MVVFGVDDHPSRWIERLPIHSPFNLLLSSHSTPHGPSAASSTSWGQWGDPWWLRLGLDYLVHLRAWPSAQGWVVKSGSGESTVPAHPFRPCLYIDIYPLFFFFLSLPEKPPQDAAEDNPLFSASFFLFLLVFFLILLLLFLLYYYYYYWLYAVSGLLSLHHGPRPPLANLKSSGWKVRPWEPQRRVSNFDFLFVLGKSVLVPPFSPTLFSVGIRWIQDWRSHVIE